MMGSEHAIVPPSPGVPLPSFEALSVSAAPLRDMPSRRNKSKGNARTGAGVKKQARKKYDDKTAKLEQAVKAAKEKLGVGALALQKPFRFMDLPGGKCFTPEQL